MSVLEDRFPALFEIHRLSWPTYESLRSGEVSEQGIEGFIDHIFLPNFRWVRRMGNRK